MRSRIVTVMFLVLTYGAMADGKGISHVPLPADLSGALNGTDYIIRVPANWNGSFADVCASEPNRARAGS